MTASRAANWVPDFGNFGTRLALVRHTMGWNAKEAAMACGFRAQSWREWELHGRRPRDYEAVCKQISARTGCDLIWLLVGEIPLPTNPGGTGTIQPVGESVDMDLSALLRSCAA